jgi:hypothetical protein
LSLSDKSFLFFICFRSRSHIESLFFFYAFVVDRI